MLVVNPHFRTGLVDDTYRYRVDWQEALTALLEATNWDVLESGALRRRRGFRRPTNANATDWTSASWNTSYDVGMLPFTRSSGQEYIVLIECQPSSVNITVRIYYPAGGTFPSIASGATQATQKQATSRDIQYAQVGDSLFFILADDDTTIDYVFRLYHDGTNFQMEKVTAEIELTGLWSGAGAANYVDPTFLGDWALNSADVETQITESASAANFAVPAKELYPHATAGDELYVDGSWRNITAVNGSGGANPNRVTFSGAALTEHIANARLRFRYDTGTTDVNAIYARALTFFEGRLCLGRVRHTRYDPRPSFVVESGPTRLRCSRSNDPFLLVPSPHNAYEDSPIDAVLWAPQLRSINWLAGGRVMYVGGANGVVVVKSGLTPKSIQTVTIDSMGTCATPPVVEQSGIIYVDASRNALVRLVYNDGSDGYRGVVLNARCSEKLNGFRRVVMSSGKQGGIRRMYALRSDGTLASCGFDEEGQPFGWVKYEIGPGDGTFTFHDICDLNGRLYALVLSDGLSLGTRKLLVRLDTADQDFVGDFYEIATTGGSPTNFRVLNEELWDCTVGVTTTVGSEEVCLGVFETDADGYIFNENGEPLKYHAGTPDVGLYDVSVAYVYRVFESRAKPLPAIPQRPDGAGFGRNHRVNKAFIGVLNTRQIKVGGHVLGEPAAIGSNVLQNRRAITGWVPLVQMGFADDHDIAIESSGVYNATVAGLSREVT